MEISKIGEAAKKASIKTAQLSTGVKNDILQKSADALIRNKERIIEINKEDVKNAVKNGVKQSFIDRLTLTEKRIEDMAAGLRDIAMFKEKLFQMV